MSESDKFLYQLDYCCLKKPVIHINCCSAFILSVLFAAFVVSGCCQPQLDFDPELTLAGSSYLHLTCCISNVTCTPYTYTCDQLISVSHNNLPADYVCNQVHQLLRHY